MQGILSGGLLVVAFAAVAGLALLMAVRLYRISRLGQSRVGPGEPPSASPGPAAPRSASPGPAAPRSASLGPAAPRSASLDPATPPHA